MQQPAFARLSAILAHVTLALMVLLPAMAVAVPLWFGDVAPVLLSGLGLDATLTPGPVATLAAYSVGLLPLVALLVALSQMRGLFLAYASGAVLTADAARRILRIGQAFLALALIPLLVMPAQTVLLTLTAPPGQRVLSVGLSSDMLGFALVSGLLILIGWAMRDAADVAAENRAFV